MKKVIRKIDIQNVEPVKKSEIPISALKELVLTAVKPTSFNPPIRTLKTSDLEESIELYGQQEPIHVVKMEDGSLEIADGNRRHKALLNLGKKQVRALVYDGGKAVLHKLYIELNAPKMTLKDSQMTAAALSGAPAFNSSVEKTSTYLKSIFAADELPILVKNNVGPYLVSVAKKVARYTDKNGSRVLAAKEGTADFDKFVKKTILWFVRHKTQQKSIAYMRCSLASANLRKAIDNDKPTLPHVS